jgi:hypothetical protein
MAPDRVPTTELGQVLDRNIGFPDVFGAGARTDSQVNPMDESEHVAAWLWPNSITTVERMRPETMIEALVEGLLWPILGWRWGLSPGKASEASTLRMAEDLGLPMIVAGDAGSDTVVEVDSRFNHRDHLYHSLLACLYGYYFFEIKGRLDEQGAARLVKLAPRPPHTISQISVDADGGLEWMQQQGFDPPRIPISRMVVFVWRKEGGNWWGRSMLRSVYGPWLAKERLVRDDLTKHRRNATGMPLLEMDADPTEDQKREGWKLVESYRSADKGGGLLPAGWKLHLQGVEGGTSDPIESAKYHDTQMARRFQQMVMELGTSASGNRALGETFQDLLRQAQCAIAEWYRDTMQQHVIEDFTRWNDGPGAPAPKLVFDYEPEPDVDAIQEAVKDGVVQMDDHVENIVRARLKLPPVDPATVRKPAAVPGAVIDPSTGLPAAPFPGRRAARPASGS